MRSSCSTVAEFTRFSQWDYSGGGTSGGPTRLTPSLVAQLADELREFAEDCATVVGPRYEPIINGAYLLTVGGRLQLVARFLERTAR